MCIRDSLGNSFAKAIGDLNILNVDNEEYDLVLQLDNGQQLYRRRFTTNLFRNDGTDTYVTMYTAAGRAALDLRFDKRHIIYDVSHNSTVIPAIGLAFDFDDYDEDSEEIKAYKRLKPLSLTFTRRTSVSLHYLV